MLEWFGFSNAVRGSRMISLIRELIRLRILLSGIGTQLLSQAALQVVHVLNQKWVLLSKKRTFITVSIIRDGLCCSGELCTHTGHCLISPKR